MKFATLLRTLRVASYGLIVFSMPILRVKLNFGLYTFIRGLEKMLKGLNGRYLETENVFLFSFIFLSVFSIRTRVKIPKYLDFLIEVKILMQ